MTLNRMSISKHNANSAVDPFTTGSISLVVGTSRNETAPGGQVNLSAGDANSPLEAGAVNISAGNNHHESGERTLPSAVGDRPIRQRFFLRSDN